MDRQFSLRFDGQEIRSWASRYEYGGDEEIEQVIVPRIRRRGWIGRQDFLALCWWKSPRTQRRCEQNGSDFIKAVTLTAYATRVERLRIEVLTLLDGVSWPTASVLLHFGLPNRYPILDYRALWSLSVQAPREYDFALWWAYTTHCRALARRYKVSMRTLDRALWQYSNENQS